MTTSPFVFYFSPPQRIVHLPDTERASDVSPRGTAVTCDQCESLSESHDLRLQCTDSLKLHLICLLCCFFFFYFKKNLPS